MLDKIEPEEAFEGTHDGPDEYLRGGMILEDDPELWRGYELEKIHDW